MTRICDLNLVFRQKRHVKHIAAMKSLRTQKIFAAHVEKRCSIRNRSNTWFSLVTALIFSVISWRKFQIWWFFLNASAGHWKRCGGPHVARGPLIAHPCPKQISARTTFVEGNRMTILVLCSYTPVMLYTQLRYVRTFCRCSHVFTVHIAANAVAWAMSGP